MRGAGSGCVTIHGHLNSIDLNIVHLEVATIDSCLELVESGGEISWSSSLDLLHLEIHYYTAFQQAQKIKVASINLHGHREIVQHQVPKLGLILNIDQVGRDR